jgi:hypothetical protein
MTKEQFEAKLVGVKPKYQKQFREIYESNESFKGDFNLMAFLFGGIWAISKGLWTVAIVGIIISIFSVGFGAIAVWIYFGVRGTYLYYKLKIDGKQVIL